MSLNQPIGSSIIEFEQLDSTNDYAMQLANEGNAEHGTTIIAQHQTKGKGQQGKTWTADKEKNLLLSFILDTAQQEIGTQFLLNAAFCTAVAHLLMEDEQIADVSIKWPNDLYIGKKKVAGILIENIIRGQHWKYAIVGIGLNVNQIDFPTGLAATSLRKRLGQEVPINRLRKKIFNRLNAAYRQYQTNQTTLLEEYNSLLYNYQSELTYIEQGEKKIGVLRGTDSTGLLAIDDKEFRHGDIQLIL
jgi:BirA family biotin operon repressor/biotin-[acetyl-CoA-carboxylase] ligase